MPFRLKPKSAGTIELVKSAAPVRPEGGAAAGATAATALPRSVTTVLFASAARTSIRAVSVQRSAPGHCEFRGATAIALGIMRTASGGKPASMPLPTTGALPVPAARATLPFSVKSAQMQRARGSLTNSVELSSPPHANFVGLPIAAEALVTILPAPRADAALDEATPFPRTVLMTPVEYETKRTRDAELSAMKNPEAFTASAVTTLRSAAVARRPSPKFAGTYAALQAPATINVEEFAYTARTHVPELAE